MTHRRKIVFSAIAIASVAIAVGVYRLTVRDRDSGLEQRTEGSQTDDPSEKKELHLTLGGERWGLLFESEGLPPELKRAIAEDLDRVYSALPEHRTLPLPSERIFRVDGRDRLCRTHLDFSVNPDYRVPRILASDFGFVLDQEEVKFTVVTSKIIAAYRVAISLRNAHDNAIAELPLFLKMVNGIDQSFIVDDHKVKTVFYSREEAPTEDYDASFFRKNVSTLRDYRLREPSLLSFKAPSEDVDSLHCKVQLVERESGRFSQELVLGYSAGRWGIVVY